MLAALLADARPVAVAERELTVAFPAGAAFLKRKAEQDDHRRVTADGAADGDRPARSACATSCARTATLEQPDGTPALSGEELVRRFMEEFDAEEILEEDDPDRGKATD